MTGNPPERLQLTIPITQRSRRHLTNYLYLIVVLPGFPVSLTAMENGCVNCKLSHGDARKKKNTDYKHSIQAVDVKATHTEMTG